jgi:TonB family protein
MNPPRLSYALLASMAMHFAFLLALASGNIPALPGMPGDALHVSLLAPREPAPGSRNMKRRESTLGDLSSMPYDEWPRTGLIPARPGTESSSDETPHDDTIRDAEATAAARTLQSLVYEALAAHFSYPPLARQNGWQGEVRLGMHIEPSGEIRRIHVLASSGYGILDRAALRSLKAVGRVPRAVELLRGSGFDLVLPVRYRLLDG